MFSELLPILESANLMISVTGNAVEMTVTILPQPKGEKPEEAERQPLCLTATAAELDAELAAILTEYSASYRRMADVIVKAKEAMAMAEKEIKIAADKKKGEATTAKAKAKASEPKPETKSMFDTDDDDDKGGEE